MSNYINYVNHNVYTPSFYLRNFDLDLPKEECRSAWQESAKRVTLLAVPFLSLYKPLGSVISVGMGTCRSFTHLSQAISSGKDSAWGECSLQLLACAFAVFAVAASIFYFETGLLITSLVDIIQGGFHLCQHLSRKEYTEAVDDVLKILGSLLYVAILLSGSLEVVLVATLLQVVISWYEARQEFSQGRYPEALAKMVMGGIRLYQAGQTYTLIEKRDDFLKKEKYFALFARAQKGRAVRELLENPLVSLQEQVEGKEVILFDAEGKPLSFGSHFHGHGEGLVKGANLTFRTKVIDGKEVTELDFKVSHVFREKLQHLIEEMEAMNGTEVKELLAIAGSHATDVRIEEGNFPVGSQEIGPSHHIALEGLGTVLVGGSKEELTLYNRVIVRMDAQKNIFDLHEMLSLLGLNTALAVSSREDMLRLKMGHLYHTLSPREALSLERDEKYFSLTLPELKEEMIKRSPEIEKEFETYLDKLEQHEILPGRIRYRIPGLARELETEGACSLTASVIDWDNDAAFEKTASILKMGMLSSEMRFSNNLNIDGFSSYADFTTGGADSVFTQLITENDCKQNRDLNDLYYYGGIQLVISLDALETGTYQYQYDNFGTREMISYYSDGYTVRPSVHEFVKEMQSNPKIYPGNEVMIKERIAPEFIKGIIVPNVEAQAQLTEYLKSLGLDKRWDQFIRVGRHATKELFA